MMVYTVCIPGTIHITDVDSDIVYVRPRSFSFFEEKSKMMSQKLEVNAKLQKLDVHTNKDRIRHIGEYYLTILDNPYHSSR